MRPSSLSLQRTELIYQIWCRQKCAFWLQINLCSQYFYSLFPFRTYKKLRLSSKKAEPDIMEKISNMDLIRRGLDVNNWISADLPYHNGWRDLGSRKCSLKKSGQCILNALRMSESKFGRLWYELCSKFKKRPWIWKLSFLWTEKVGKFYHAMLSHCKSIKAIPFNTFISSVMIVYYYWRTKKSFTFSLDT